MLKGLKGGFSGGTIASMMNIINYTKLYPDKRNMLKSTLSLNPVWKLKIMLINRHLSLFDGTDD